MKRRCRWCWRNRYVDAECFCLAEWPAGRPSGAFEGSIAEFAVQAPNGKRYMLIAPAGGEPYFESRSIE